MKRRGFAVGLLFWLVIIPVTGCHSQPHTDSMAPDFELAAADQTGIKTKLSQVYATSPVLIAFWASWCPSCVEEVPELNQWQEKFAARGLKILAVNVEEERKDVVEFIKTHRVQYPVLLDQDGEVANRYGLVGLPVAVLLAKGGKIIYYGFSLPPNLEQILESKETQG